ncbi:DMSO/TMAO reductase YedYZ molybdopterin-dependent catalytic subunit [Pedobacter sp. UYEF25]
MEMKAKKNSQRQIVLRTSLSFAAFAVFIVGATFLWFKVKNASTDRGIRGGVQIPLRKGLNANEQVFNKAFSKRNLAKEFPKSEAAKIVRVNGNVGLNPSFNNKNWRLNVIRSAGDTLKLTLADIQKLPKTEVIFNFKCIEGWSQVSHWGGVKFSDFIKAYHLEKQAGKEYIGLITPDGQYYVGIDMESAMQPQTLLCYEMNGVPLPVNQGYPLRLIIPVKYGIKSLKRIGDLSFSNSRPPDYWFERGYDYYAGL